MGRHHRRTRWEWTRPAAAAVLVSASLTGSGWAVTALTESPPAPPVAAPPPLVPVPPKPGPTIAPPTTSALPTTSKEVVAAEKATSPPAAPKKPAPPPPPPQPKARECSTELAGTRPFVAAAGHFLALRLGIPLSRIGGVGDRPQNPSSDHPKGLALDFMITGSKADELADYAVAHRAELGVSYVIWNRRIWTDASRGWRAYSGYSPHTDHVHVSFEAGADVNVTC